MSLEIVRQVNQQHPQLLQQNINSTCYQFVVHVIAALRAAGHEAFHVCKSPGEGKYTPPGFAPRDVIGLDGKTYRCSGVSHDAIWADGIIVDTIARGNDFPVPIKHPDGSHMTGEAVWNAIPQQHWRPNNPPLKDGAPTLPPPQPPQPPAPTITVPGREEALDELNALDAYYKAADGLKRPNGLSLDGKPDFLGIAAWYLDVYQQARIKGKTRAEARAAYVSDIRHSDEWRQKHQGETP